MCLRRNTPAPTPGCAPSAHPIAERFYSAIRGSFAEEDRCVIDQSKLRLFEMIEFRAERFRSSGSTNENINTTCCLLSGTLEECILSMNITAEPRII